MFWLANTNRQRFIILKEKHPLIRVESSSIALLGLFAAVYLPFLKNVTGFNSWRWTYRQYMCLSAAEGAAKQIQHSRVGQISGYRLASC